MVKPHIIQSIKNADGSDYKVTPVEYSGDPISKKVADDVKDMMEKKCPKAAVPTPGCRAIIWPVKPARPRNWIR